MAKLGYEIKHGKHIAFRYKDKVRFIRFTRAKIIGEDYTEDELFSNEYASKIALYKAAATEMLKHYKKLPNIKEALAKLDLLQEKKNTLMEEYSESKDIMDDLFLIRKNFEQYMGKEMER